MIPGEIRMRLEPVAINEGVARVTIVMVNTGDRPIQIGSHFHLPDANRSLKFDGELPAKHRLDIPAGTSIRLEPGVSREVELVPLGGRQRVPGLQIKPGTHKPAPVSGKTAKAAAPAKKAATTGKKTAKKATKKATRKPGKKAAKKTSGRKRR